MQDPSDKPPDEVGIRWHGPLTDGSGIARPGPNQRFATPGER